MRRYLNCYHTVYRYTCPVRGRVEAIVWVEATSKDAVRRIIRAEHAGARFSKIE